MPSSTTCREVIDQVSHCPTLQILPAQYFFLGGVHMELRSTLTNLVISGTGTGGSSFDGESQNYPDFDSSHFHQPPCPVNVSNPWDKIRTVVPTVLNLIELYWSEQRSQLLPRWFERLGWISILCSGRSGSLPKWPHWHRRSRWERQISQSLT